MGEAIMKAVLRKGIAGPEAIMASDASAERRQHLAEHLGIAVTAENRQAALFGDVTVLSVKPQVMPAVLGELQGALRGHQVALSIAAGVRMQSIGSGLRHNRVVRSMPNTPAQIAEGVTVWTCTPETSQEQRQMAASILGSTGQEIYVPDEKYIDMATALSGSGPAYVYLFIEALIDAGVYIGIPRDTAQRLVLQTLIGSVRLEEETGHHPAELRNMVTSPGGTTAEALAEFEESNFRTIVTNAVVAAYEKAKSLGG